MQKKKFIYPHFYFYPFRKLRNFYLHLEQKSYIIIGHAISHSWICTSTVIFHFIFLTVYHPLIITRVKRSTARIQQATSWLESQPLGRETSPATLIGLCTGPPITIRLLAQGITITPDCGDNNKISTKSKEVFILVFSGSMCIWHNGQKCSTLIYHGQNSVHTL